MKEKYLDVFTEHIMRIIVEKDNGHWAIYEEHREEPIYQNEKKATTLKVAKDLNKIKKYDLVVIP
jgi:hypothetical protein